MQWDPEQIAASLTVNHETIYKHVYAGKAQGDSLWKQLHDWKKRRERYASGKSRRGYLIGMRRNPEHPASVEARSRVSRWDGDTIIGAGREQAIVMLVAHKSGFAVLSHTTRKTYTVVSTAVITSLVPLAPRIRTVSCDNGRERSDHIRVDKALESSANFSDPIAGWLRDSDENVKGLLRQYIP